MGRRSAVGPEPEDRPVGDSADATCAGHSDSSSRFGTAGLYDVNTTCASSRHSSVRWDTRLPGCVGYDGLVASLTLRGPQALAALARTKVLVGAHGCRANRRRAREGV